MQVQQSATNNNVQAFLMMIRKCEGTGGANGFNLVYGGGTFSDMSDHPAITGEWTGRVLTDTQCANAGFGPGCKSTAAGAFQITKSTWKRLKAKLGLTDFSEPNQILAAIELLREDGVLEEVTTGDVVQALQDTDLGATWASLPTAKTKQNPKSQATALAYYTDAGGQIA